MPDRKLPDPWGFNLSQEERDQIEFLLRNNLLLTNQILFLLNKFLNEEERRELDPSQYQDTSWAFAQADRNGARRALTKVRRLFDFVLNKET